LAVYLRPDLYFVGPLPADQMRNTTRLGRWYTPNFHTWSGFNDRFMIGHPTAMRALGMRMRYIEWFLHQSPKANMHAERYLKGVSDMLGLHSTAIEGFLFLRVRATGVVEHYTPSPARRRLLGWW
jgi:hypothetical protein